MSAGRPEAARLLDAEGVDELLRRLAERMRSALASQRAALEALESLDEVRSSPGIRFAAIIAEESAKLDAALEEADRAHGALRGAASDLRPVAVRDLLAATARRVESKLGIEAAVGPVDADLWLRSDGDSLGRALAYLASRLRYELAIDRIALAATRDGSFARISLAWPAKPLALDTWRTWESQPLRMGGEASALAFSEVLRRHDGEAWQQYEGAAARGVIELIFPSPRAAATAEK